MNRRIRRPASKADEAYLRYLKPGALAQLRDSRIIARSHRATSESQIYLYRTSSSPSSSPPRSPIAGQPPTATMDDLPCFVGRICGPRFPQRKKMVAAKSVFFLSSSLSVPASDAPDPIIDMYSNDFLVAH